MGPAYLWIMLVMSQWTASCQSTMQAPLIAPDISVTELLAPAPAPGPSAAPDAAVMYSADETAAVVVSSADGLAANDCRNLGAVLGNMETSFLGSIHTAVVGPVSIAYRRFGPLNSSQNVQPPLIMVIGIACTMSDWTPRLLRALAANRELIIYDSPGIGRSTIEAGWSVDPADYFKFQGDMLAGLITALQLHVTPDVLGWSLGAKIALHLGVYHSSIFGRLIADAGSAGGPNSSTAVIDAVGQGAPVVERLMKLKALLQRPSDTAAVCQWIIEKQTMPLDDVTAEEVRFQVEAEVGYHKAQNSIVAILPRIKNPTLVITSGNDLTNPPSNEVDVVAGIPGAVLVTFQGCGHLTPFQEVDKFVSLVNSFLATQGSFQPQPQNSSAYQCQGIGLPDKAT